MQSSVEPPSRLRALRNLVELREPLSRAINELASFDPDSDEELITLTPAHVARLLEKYLLDELGESEVETWAEVLSGRDDVALSEPAEDLLKQVLFELSTPEIHEPISRGMAVQWVERLLATPG